MPSTGGIHAQVHPALCVNRQTHPETKATPGFHSAYYQPWFQSYGLERIETQCIENILLRGEDLLLLALAMIRESQLLAMLEKRNQLLPSAPARVEYFRNVCKQSYLSANCCEPQI